MVATQEFECQGLSLYLIDLVAAVRRERKDVLPVFSSSVGAQKRQTRNELFAKKLDACARFMTCYIITKGMVIINTSIRSSEDRQGDVLLFIKEKGTASIPELAVKFAVSEMTVRRVILKLADAGLVIRTPGGAMAALSGSMERSFLERSAKMAGAKDAIGREAAKLVQNGETVVLDSGTTTRYVARYLGRNAMSSW
jgi:hypothetical protein